MSKTGLLLSVAVLCGAAFSASVPAETVAQQPYPSRVAPGGGSGTGVAPTLPGGISSSIGKTGTGIAGGNPKVEGMKPVVVTPIIPLTDTIKKRPSTFHEQLANAAACRNECNLMHPGACDRGDAQHSASCNILTNCHYRCQGYIKSR
jgi:hypothetical protein